MKSMPRKLAHDTNMFAKLESEIMTLKQSKMTILINLGTNCLIIVDDLFPVLLQVFKWLFLFTYYINEYKLL